MLVDAHAHYDDASELEVRQKISTVFCGTNPENAGEALALRGVNAYVSCGLHPWHTDRWSVEEMIPFIEGSDALGEIGLDSVWTDVSMDCQREAFTQQLDVAAQLTMPVILHTKGMELEIAQTIARYPVRAMVHWYSCMDYLDAYLAQDCYFTIGCDYAANRAVRQVISRVPLNRLLTETDGLHAMEWAFERSAKAEEISTVLEGELEAIAATHGITLSAAEGQVSENLERFLGI